jgi:two-component system cell cycle response regulator
MASMISALAPGYAILYEAGIVINRISGILSYTDFAVPEDTQPVTLEVEVGMAELEPQDTAESLIAQARENLG